MSHEQIEELLYSANQPRAEETVAEEKQIDDSKPPTNPF
jgi:hypothetical protein